MPYTREQLNQELDALEAGLPTLVDVVPPERQLEAFAADAATIVAHAGSQDTRRVRERLGLMSQAYGLTARKQASHVTTRIELVAQLDELEAVLPRFIGETDSDYVLEGLAGFVDGIEHSIDKKDYQYLESRVRCMLGNAGLIAVNERALRYG
ncbi:MAG: hypothetical protein H7Y61_16010 [Rhizobiales bacterium]|nr:hypothetical protein [Rhizobacter sp.]